MIARAPPISRSMEPRAAADRRQGQALERRVALTLFAVGAVVCGVGALLKPDLTRAARDVQLGAAGGFALIGLLVAALPRRTGVVEAAALVSVVLLGALMGSSNAIGATPFFFLWPLVHLAYFSRKPMVIAGFAVMAVSVIVAMVANPYASNRADTIVGTIFSVGLMTGVVTMMTRRERQLQLALARAADTDALTGLLNRRGLGPELERRVAGATRRPGARLAVVMVDLDHFKRFNDRHGHPVGDAALIRLAGALTAAARDGDHVARIGGEEFLVVLPGADAGAAQAYAADVMARLASEEIDETLRLTVSAGIATHGPAARSVHELMRSADQALYRAKRTGRARAVVALGEAA